MDAPGPSHRNFNIHISPFLGDPDLLEFFISQINEVCASNKYSAQDSLVFAKSKLDGPAKTFIVQNLEYQNINSTSELFKILRAQFKKQSVCRTISEFNSMSMLSGESISNLAHCLDSLVRKAHQSIKDINALNAIKFNKFISIIPNSYRMHILQCNIQTYVDAVEKARLLQDCEVNNELICQISMNTPILDLKDHINELKKSIAHFAQKQSDSDTSSNRNQL